MANFLDFIFPKKCVSCKKLGSYLCENCFAYLSFDANSLCLVCDKPSYNGLTHPICRKKYTIDGCFSALSYNKTAQKLIYNFKYKPYLTDLKTVLADLFYESLIQNENFNKELEKGEWAFVPIPLFASKFRKRGYNQAEILAKELSKNFNSKTMNILKRTRDTKTQVGLSNIDRKLNIKDAFELNSSFIINHLSLKNANIFLVDDVVTTGATLLEAAKILKKAGAKRVIGLTLARD
ncbi:MAG: ComF family protein [Patescibacteria group bacterium]|nr:ComF family protein [Patescibacteria group bacterium]